jgi:hypothetical protein
MNIRKDKIGIGARLARPSEVFGLRQYQVDAATITVQGSIFVFGNDIQVRLVDQDVVVGYLRNALPSWFHVSAPMGMVLQYRFGRPGLVAVVDAGRVPTGVSLLGLRAAINVGSSRALQVLGEFPQCGAALSGNQEAYYAVNPTVGIPGCRLGSATKTAATAGAAGYTALVVVAVF